MGEEMKEKILVLACLGSVNVAGESVNQLGEVVVTATQTPVQKSVAGAGVQVIGNKEIEDSGLSSVSDVLEKLAGLNMSRAGDSGQASSLFLRGSESSYVKVLVDGVALQDPSDLNRAPSLNGISLSQVSRIEIVKRPSSVVWGSDAISGVVQIITKPATEDKGELYSEFGANQTQGYGFSFQQASDKLSFSIFGDLRDSDGISVADDRTNSEKDGYRHKNIGLDFEIRSENGNQTRVQYKHSDLYSEFDGYLWGVGPVDSPNFVEETRGIFHLQHEFGVTEQAFNRFSFSSYRTIRDITDVQNGNTRQNGEEKNYKYLRSIDKGDAVYTFGLEHQRELVTGISQEILQNQNFLEYVRYFDHDITFIGGYRGTHHSTFGYHSSHSGVLTKDWDRFSVSASYGTGFKSPTLNQLYGQWGPNPSLKPVESISRDISLSYNYEKGKSTFSVFRNDYENQIVWAGVFPTQSYKNVASSEVNGWEFSHIHRFNHRFSVDLSYEKLTEATQNGNQPLLRRPDSISNIAFCYSQGKDTVRLGRRAKEERFDVGNVLLPSYKLWDFSWKRKLDETTDVSLWIENITDDFYQEQDGYSSPGRGAYIKVTTRF
jgi:vitamin B12 transporter